MSKHAIHQYYNRLDQYKRFGGTRNESSIRRAFANLLEEYCLPKHLVLVDELHLQGSQKRPDGTVKNANQLDWGHWESKDFKDALDEHILDKLDKGYPTFNILFENSVEIVLIQEGQQRLRGPLQDANLLDRVLTAFVEYERPEVKAFREAIEKFRADIPDIVETLRAMIAAQAETNSAFKKARAEFWELCKKSINPDITEFDIREMLIQHILTAEIFNTIFAEGHFHRENNVARELERVVNTFFTGALRRNTLAGIDSYYKAITTEASRITDHHEKQKFLKVIYENFYKAYNPKGADRLGIVYTPNEIVSFMIQGADYLLEKHFGRTLADKHVEILDPATGTGTFISDIIEHIPPQYLEYKYQHEIHANEVAILPYYIANLNIEYTYQQKIGTYLPFENIVFVDTLDNLGFGVKGEQESLFGFSAENLERIKRQNERKISVIIGNPPYNANQMNENDNNKNREYFRDKKKKTGGVDGRIKDTYVKQSSAQKTKVYDMYSRFIRWASDRVDQNGIIAFITNRSYIDKRTFDGFRKCVAQEFDDIYLIDTRSDVRENPKIAGTTHNVFGIQTGVALMFLVKTAEHQRKQARIHYITLTDEMRKREKLDWFRENSLQTIPFDTITPDKDYNWINLIDNDFENLLPVATRKTKLAKSEKKEEAIFKLFSLGVVTARDEWIYNFSRTDLIDQMTYFFVVYERQRKECQSEEISDNQLSKDIKWTRDLKKWLRQSSELNFNQETIVNSLYRPFVKKYMYYDRNVNEMQYQIPSLFPHPKSKNLAICFTDPGSGKPFMSLVTTSIPDLHLVGAGCGTECLPLYRYDEQGNRIDNITDWGLQQFRDHYHNNRISKEDIFHYTYAVLHHPVYRQKYEINLKREFPRIPFYDDFEQWVEWGKALMDLHLNYERVEPYPLKLQEELIPKERPKAKLRAIPPNGTIILDENSTLLGVPAIAWEYTLGNRSALHWVLDQYKEKKPKDPTIAEKFNTYRFADYKDQVIDLLRRVCAVSVKTMEIIQEMEASQHQ